MSSMQAHAHTQTHEYAQALAYIDDMSIADVAIHEPISWPRQRHPTLALPHVELAELEFDATPSLWSEAHPGPDGRIVVELCPASDARSLSRLQDRGLIILPANFFHRETSAALVAGCL